MRQNLDAAEIREISMTSPLRLATAIIAALVAASAPAEAQGSRIGIPVKVLKQQFEIPKAYRPPPGMCRIWLTGVPAAKQPAPTDCETAIRNKPPRARVIFSEEKRGDDARKLKGGRDR